MLHRIQMNHLSVGFNGEEVLRDLSFYVPVGKMFAIIGPNGAGKSTLLKVLLGLIRPQAGEMVIEGDGKPVIGYVPQSRPIDEETPIAAKDFITLGLTSHLLPWLTRAERSKLKEIMEFTDTEMLAKKPIGRLSGGERQRVFLAQALIREPDLLLLDESTANLDPGAQEEMMRLVFRICEKRGVTVIFISHDLAQVATYADQVLLLARGKYVQGGAADLLSDQQLLAEYYQHEPVDAAQKATLESAQRQAMFH
ncbi:metal ABC transporter ATP-binding protein [Sporolactobacillus spathodeae]|uniref:ABC-type Mn2+/Zn2+ transport system ATPase subunit n=1 Tax=Sporolactobacillus spathodeae TaxID=1465502 RepID=A0ABS2QBP3_9BACL|nr:ABC transporter ATP-binding protein [Sporolactobacillus spathodeae]MBM7659006.1 ABC-type Mn2+/Zn2+ transport system ATPase subunit [Sporolactobacillus spathodeae]